MAKKGSDPDHRQRSSISQRQSPKTQELSKKQAESILNDHGHLGSPKHLKKGRRAFASSVLASCRCASARCPHGPQPRQPGEAIHIKASKKVAFPRRQGAQGSRLIRRPFSRA